MRAASPGPGGGWVSRYEMQGMGHRHYRQRIRELRLAGNVIESKREMAGSRRDTCYRLAKKAEATAYEAPVKSGGGNGAEPRPEHVFPPQLDKPPERPDPSLGQLFQVMRRFAARGNWIDREMLPQLLAHARKQEPGTRGGGILLRKDGLVEVEVRFERGQLVKGSLGAEWIGMDFWMAVHAIRFNGLVSARFEDMKMVRGDLWETYLEGAGKPETADETEQKAVQ